MDTVSVRELRNHGGDVLDRVVAGETVTVTRDGVPVAELRPLARRPLTTAELIARRQHLPSMDYEQLRRDLDEAVDPSLFATVWDKP
jgi:prevent-host-death family protein